MVKDWLGTEIKVGSVIVYPGRQGSSMWMSKAVVLEVGTTTAREWRHAPISDWGYYEKPRLTVAVDQTNYTGAVVGVRRVKIDRVDRVTVVG